MPSAGCIVPFSKASRANHLWKEELGLAGLCSQFLAVTTALTALEGLYESVPSASFGELVALGAQQSPECSVG